jgi:methyl-accepting chemotaxis protein
MMVHQFSKLFSVLLVLLAVIFILAGAAYFVFSIAFLKALTIAFLSAAFTFSIIYWRAIQPIQTHLYSLNESYLKGDYSSGNDLEIIQVLGQNVESMQKKTEGVSKTCSEFAIAGAEVSFASDILSNGVEEQIRKVEKLSETSSIVTQNIEQAAEETSHLSELSKLTSEASCQGQEAIKSANEDMQRTDKQVQSVSNLITELNQQISQILNITHEINGIADQTNLLALNASIEAARAGEHGRGFAVVADEVRSLATRTSASTSEINDMAQGINNGTSELAQAMKQLVKVVNDTMGNTQNVNEFLETIRLHAHKVDDQVGKSRELAEQNRQHQADIASDFKKLVSELGTTQKRVKDVSEHSFALSRRTENIYELLGQETLFGEHQIVLKRAQSAVEQIEEAFEQAISSNSIALDDLFDRNYVPIPNSNPTKYSTRFDEFTDRVLPAIQEPILDEKFILFAGAVDNNGYFPTHNKRYSQPLTGNYEEDLVNNRTKRIFNDPTGARCGSHQKPFLIQTYKRDTGEIVHDLSVPISVRNRHWGGFRVGYVTKSDV